MAQVQVVQAAAQRLGDGSLSASAAGRPRAAETAVTRARRRRTLTAALEIPSTPVAAARSVPARPRRVTAASVVSSPERSGRRVTRGGLSSRARISAPATIKMADQTWTTSWSQCVFPAQWYQVVQCSSSGPLLTWKAVTSMMTMTAAAARAAARMKARGG